MAYGWSILRMSRRRSARSSPHDPADRIIPMQSRRVVAMRGLRTAKRDTHACASAARASAAYVSLAQLVASTRTACAKSHARVVTARTIRRQGCGTTTIRARRAETFLYRGDNSGPLREAIIRMAWIRALHADLRKGAAHSGRVTGHAADAVARRNPDLQSGACCGNSSNKSVAPTSTPAWVNKVVTWPR